MLRLITLYDALQRVEKKQSIKNIDKEYNLANSTIENLVKEFTIKTGGNISNNYPIDYFGNDLDLVLDEDEDEDYNTTIATTNNDIIATTNNNNNDTITNDNDNPTQSVEKRKKQLIKGG